MKYIKRYSLIFFAVLLLFAFVPVQAFAVDPMSSAMMANAFAQAIAAYGSSQGVSMTFDVASTDGIGEGVHDLWKDFRASTNDADDFDSVASVFQASNPYSPQEVNLFGQTLKVVGITLDEDVKPVVDDFWNWLLTGPAEMVKVDNEYYQFSSSNSGASGSSISVNNSYLFAGQPFANRVSGLTWESAYNMSFPLYGDTISTRGYYREYSGHAYCFIYYDTTYYLVFACDAESADTSVQAVQYISTTNTYSSGGTWTMNTRDTNTRLYYTRSSLNSLDGVNPDIPVFSSLSSGLLQISSNIISPTSDTIGVRAYDEDGIATIPDTNAADYIDTTAPIPVDVPWDDTLFGDGTGTLTDAQKQAIVSDLTDALAEDGVVDLAETDNPSPPVPDPDIGEVMFPLIPINVPSFNFSLSGIWHYVREWVSSLGAWLSMLFTIWAALPYAMVVPVYACIVIVIVLGLYRRFFM